MEAKKIAPSVSPLEAKADAKNQIIDTSSLPEPTDVVKGSSSPTLVDLDDIQFRMKCAIDLVDTVHEAMVYGSCAAEHYTDALFGARDYLRGLNTEFHLCIENMLAARAKEVQHEKQGKMAG